MKLLPVQYKTVSEILGNISVAWFTAGIVSPFFLSQVWSTYFMLYLVLGTCMFGCFGIVSVYFAGKAIK